MGESVGAVTYREVLTVEHRFWKHAVQSGYLDANPALYVERPRIEIEEMQALTPPEIRHLLDAAAEPVRTLLLCAMLTGMRRGELLGPRWEDIDFDGNQINVRRALWRGTLVTPKSRCCATCKNAEIWTGLTRRTGWIGGPEPWTGDFAFGSAGPSLRLFKRPLGSCGDLDGSGRHGIKQQ